MNDCIVERKILENYKRLYYAIFPERIIDLVRRSNGYDFLDNTDCNVNISDDSEQVDIII